MQPPLHLLDRTAYRHDPRRRDIPAYRFVIVDPLRSKVKSVLKQRSGRTDKHVLKQRSGRTDNV